MGMKMVMREDGVGVGNWMGYDGIEQRHDWRLEGDGDGIGDGNGGGKEMRMEMGTGMRMGKGM